MFHSRGDRDLGVAFQTHPGSQASSRGKQRTPLSSRVAPGISWTQLSGLKGVNPPVKFGERTRDCSPGQAGKEGPHLSLTGASCGFSRTAAPLWVFSRGTMGYPKLYALTVKLRAGQTEPPDKRPPRQVQDQGPQSVSTPSLSP